MHLLDSVKSSLIHTLVCTALDVCENMKHFGLHQWKMETFLRIRKTLVSRGLCRRKIKLERLWQGIIYTYFSQFYLAASCDGWIQRMNRLNCAAHDFLCNHRQKIMSHIPTSAIFRHFSVDVVYVFLCRQNAVGAACGNYATLGCSEMRVFVLRVAVLHY